MSTIWKPGFVRDSLKESFARLNPISLWRNPVMIIVEAGAVVTLFESFRIIAAHGDFSFHLQISIWLWFTVLFANFGEAFAEIQGKARANSLKNVRSLNKARRMARDGIASGAVEEVPATDLRSGNIVIVAETEMIPGDGDVIEGTILVDESAITGESAPVIRESGGDRCGVTGGTKVLSGSAKIRISANPGDSFLDRMISMVENARRTKTPNEIALEILLISLTALFIVVVVTLPLFGNYMNVTISITVLVSLLVCLMPTTIGALLPAIGIAGMDRLLQKNVIALSGRAVEAAGDVNIVLLDKTGTITLGNRMANEFILADAFDMKEFIETAVLASIADETPEGRSVLTLAKKELGVRGRDMRAPNAAIFVPFTPQSRMSGITIGTREIRKGSMDAIELFVRGNGGAMSDAVRERTALIARNGDTPLVVAEGRKVLGIIRLKDIVKEGIANRIAKLREMGIRSVMITGDNRLTATSIAAEAGVDDFIAEAKPEMKLARIRSYQAQGYLVAMIGDGTNDAPALAQADVAVAMNGGTQAAREAANMVDLDSSPTKLLDIVEIGKEILITRGALTTFSIANDVAKYFAIIPALFAAAFPVLGILNIMHLTSPQSAVLSAVIFNALIIPLLIPLALRGVKYRASSVSALLRKNIFIYGAGGILLPFIGIKLVDMLIVAMHLVK
ncbi:MAG: potassium-transporting ATPase subunit KdpB [Spirochaetota bacterium]